VAEGGEPDDDADDEVPEDDEPDDDVELVEEPDVVVAAAVFSGFLLGESFAAAFFLAASADARASVR
jgi:hypothetical protein